MTRNKFNKQVDKLPPTLTHLTTGESFNQPVDKLPPTLTHFTIKDRFNQAIDKLPPTLTHPQLEKVSTNQSVNFHPHSLTHNWKCFQPIS
jgi:hypothetical protein